MGHGGSSKPTTPEEIVMWSFLAPPHAAFDVTVAVPQPTPLVLQG